VADDFEARRRATARGEKIRAALIAALRGRGPASAADLHPLMPTEISLSEVAFQLDRLREEGLTEGGQGGPYRLA
jgi:hypothetical protein